jgi:hypothetical protein
MSNDYQCQKAQEEEDDGGQAGDDILTQFFPFLFSM